VSNLHLIPLRLLRLLLWATTVVVVGVVLLIVSGVTYEALSRARVAREFPPEGRLIDIGGRRIQLDCRGTGSPIVILESGLDIYGSLSWALVQNILAKRTRTCSYSRAGVMWSDPGPSPRDGETVAADLHSMLVKAGERPPYVLVGHSLGVPYVMIYTHKYPAEVSGLVFVEGSHPDQVRRFAENMPHPNYAVGISTLKRKWVGRLGIVRLLGYTPPSSGPRSEKETYAYEPTSRVGSSQENDSFSATLAEAGSAENFGARPLYVLTSTLPYTPQALAAWGGTADQGRRQQDIWLQMHNEQASWSNLSHHELIADSDHYIQISRPDAVVTGVTWVLDRVPRTSN
jgi:pimeloyl-ACP methyl ester carboxylesterase